MRELLITLVGISFIFANPVFAINGNPINTKTVQDTVTVMPKVFVLGSHEMAYDQLSMEYSTSLLSACGDDTNIAREKWNSLVSEMEAHAEMLDYDLKGVKLWLHVFWDEKGRINHLGYYLKPNSRNVDRIELAAFLTDFINNYYVPSASKSKFSHYSWSAFPILRLKKT